MKKYRLLIASFLTLFIAAGLAHAMDMARVESGVDAAAAQYGVSGEGVIVAILDRGIDWKNNDFRNEDGTTRIKWIFDLTDDTGASDPGNPYGVGTIYTEEQINAALDGSGPTLATRDAVGHGTTSTGIAAGNGRNVAKYRGVAERATLIVVKVVTEGAPAHDGEPAEAPFYDPARVPVAIDFAKDKAAALGMPCVMLLNSGSIGGPTDGTSALARKIDSTVGPGIPGLIFVTGPGDDGGVANRAGGVVTKGGSVTLQITKTQSGPMFFDLWYPEGDPNNPTQDNLDVTLHTPSGDYGPYPAPSGPNGFDDRFLTAFDYYHRGSNTDFAGAENGKRNLYINFKEGPGSYSVTLSGAPLLTSDRRFDVTLNPSNIHQTPSANVFTNFLAPGNIYDGASAFNNVCPGDYVIRTEWTDINGMAQSNTGEGSIGEIWKGSSAGPTFDGRLGVDVCAPGDSVFTTYNPTSYFATFPGNLIEDGNGFYGRANAVSAAAPQVTGIIALMLQADPQLDAPAVKQILQETARSDSFTGTIPNATWGFGKVDALAAVARVASVGQALNISTRLRVLAGDNVLIGGFIITGTESKEIIVRAIGPSLSGFGVPGALADPLLELHDSTGATIASNDNWKETQQTEIEATGLAPSHDLESAIVQTLAPDLYTAIVRGKGGASGVGLVEVYDLSADSVSSLANISTRGFVDTGDNAMIGGFIIGGADVVSDQVLVRAIGPSLIPFGVPLAIEDPTIELHDGNGAIIAANDNWEDTQKAEIMATGLAPTDKLESAIVASLPTGLYTAILRGKDNTTGVGLVEVYSLQ